MPGTQHTCNPHQPGKPLPFGRRAPEGKCPRCDELRAGAQPRTLSWVEDRNRRRAWEPTAEEIREHDCGKSNCGSVCTAFQW